MSESAEAAPPPAAAAGKGGGKPSKIVLALLALNLGATGFGVFTLVTRSAEAAGPVKEVIIERDKSLEIKGPVLPLDKFVVNLDEPGSARYLKVGIELELANSEVAEDIEKSKEVIRDQILSHLSGLHLADTAGATAKDNLRIALMQKIDNVIGTGKVRRMFFSEFMVQ